MLIQNHTAERADISGHAVTRSDEFNSAALQHISSDLTQCDKLSRGVQHATNRDRTDPAVASSEDARLARETADLLDAFSANGLRLKLRLRFDGKDAATVDLPHAATGPLLSVLEAIGEGKTIAVQTGNAAATTSAARRAALDELAKSDQELGLR